MRIPFRWLTSMRPSWFVGVFSLLCLLSICTAQLGAHVKTILRADRWSDGPFEGQRSISCLTVFSDGKVNYFHRWNPGEVITDHKSGKKILLERTVSVERSLTGAELFEISTFLESDVVKALDTSFALPHVPADYNEGTTVYIGEQEQAAKRISIRDYGEADLEEKSRLPGALILLMDQIEVIEKAAVTKGTYVRLPSTCSPSD